MVDRTSVQNHADPLYLLGSGIKPGVKRIAQGLRQVALGGVAPCMWQGRGWDPSEGAASEHGSGRALDLMIAYQVGSRPSAGERLQGDRLAQWIIDRRGALGLRWLIWSGRIYNPSRGGWRTYTGGTGTTAGHYDHIHVYFGSGSDWTLGTITTQEEDDMPYSREQMLEMMETAVARQLWDPINAQSKDPVIKSSWRNAMAVIVARLGYIMGGMQKLLASSGESPVDEAKLAAALAPTLAPLVADAVRAAGGEAIAENVAQIFAERLAS